MFIISPWLLTAFVVFAASAFLGFAFRWQGQVRYWALAAGGLSGLLGTQLAMWPLAYCTFELERMWLDRFLGCLIVLVCTAFFLWISHWVISRLSVGEGLLPKAETYAGVFRSPLAPLLTALCLLPTLIILSIFHYYPLFQTFRLGTRLVRLGAPKTKFVCLDNYTSLFLDPNYWYSLGLTFVIALGVVTVAMSLGLLIAQMVNLPLRGANIYRALLIWPVAISPVVAGVLFQLLLNPVTGVVNHLLENSLGVRIPWLGHAGFATLSIVLTAAWNQMGFNILFFIAGLKNISPELLEAASIDGANAFQGFFRITLPLLSPFTFFLIVTNTIYAFFQTFGVIDILTRGGPVNATVSAMYRVYVVGVLGKDLGKAGAQSLVLLLIVVGITILQFRGSQERVSYGV
ncbi:MAG: sugar ABC transporter permease [Trueperaceae bacterium]|nr:sugar ABC transporter permease [Trueperaceae bacterium]